MNNRTTKLRDWLIYFLSLLTKVFGSHSEFMQKLLGLVDKTTSVSFPFDLSIGRGIRTTCNVLFKNDLDIFKIIGVMIIKLHFLYPTFC
ncbi:unnamed protein product [Schistosoma bovis]|nr:unnamed protein product [Schistosoma bovis]